MPLKVFYRDKAHMLAKRLVRGAVNKYSAYSRKEYLRNEINFT